MDKMIRERNATLPYVERCTTATVLRVASIIMIPHTPDAKRPSDVYYMRCKPDAKRPSDVNYMLPTPDAKGPSDVYYIVNTPDAKRPSDILSQNDNQSLIGQSGGPHCF